MKMTQEDKFLLRHYDSLIAQGKAIKLLKKEEFFKRFMVILSEIRREGVERMLSATKDDRRDELAGYVKFANYAVNFFETLVGESTQALENKAELMYRVREAEHTDYIQEGTRYSGRRGGTV